MKDRIILALAGGALIYTVINYLPPLYAEWSGAAERAGQAKLDAEKCASYKPVYINKVLFCQCSDTESQKPGKCSEKYKRD